MGGVVAPGSAQGWGGVITGGKVDGVDAGPDDSAHPYDEDLFLVASHDKGNTETIGCKVPETLLAWARLIVESRKFPLLRTKSDLFRLGFMRVLSWLSGLDPSPAEKSVMHQLAQMSVKIAWERRNLDYVKFIDQFAAVISDVLALPQGRVQAGRILRMMRQHFNAMDESFYKTHAEKMFNDRFGAYEQAGLVMIEAREGREGEGEGEDGGEEGDELVDLEGMMREVEEMLHAVEE